jgi:excisionase family DNA binding protein
MSSTNLFSEKERELALTLSGVFSSFIEASLTNTTGEVHFSIEGKHISIPASALRPFYEVLVNLSKGKGVSVVPFDDELTTHQAADFLGVSRKYLIDELVNKGILPVRMVGTRRKIPLQDLLSYKEENKAKRRHVLDEMAALADKEGLP